MYINGYYFRCTSAIYIPPNSPVAIYVPIFDVAKIGTTCDDTFSFSAVPYNAPQTYCGDSLKGKVVNIPARNGPSILTLTFNSNSNTNVGTGVRAFVFKTP